MARLIIETGTDTGLIYELRDEPVSIGRSASSTIQVVDKRVSRHHAILRQYRDSYVAEDLGSKNGTLINRNPLVGRVKMNHNDRLIFGDTVLLFEMDPQEQDGNGTRNTNVRLAAVEVGPSMQEQPVEPECTPSDLVPISRELLADPMRRLKVVYQVADSIRNEQKIDDLLWKIVDILWNTVIPHRAIVLLRHDESESLDPVVIRTRNGASREITISRGIVERSLSEKVAILVSDALSDLRFSANESVMAGQIRSAICAPLVYKGDVLGVIYVDVQDLGQTIVFNQDDLEMVVGIANQAAMAIVNARLYKEAISRQRMEKELEIARDIQMNLLPRDYPNLPGLEFAAMSLPARQVGGDYYDFIPMTGDRMGIALADVSGKGVPAAILTTSVRASLRVEAMQESGKSVVEIVHSVNQWACRDSTNDMFATLIFLCYDPATREITYTNAGHVHPLLFRADGSLEKLDVGGCFLGIMDFTEYESATVTLKPGDLLLIYSDGVTDAHNEAKELFGVERLIEIASASRHLSAADLRDEIYEANMEFRSTLEQFDDLTMIVIKVS